MDNLNRVYSKMCRFYKIEYKNMEKKMKYSKNEYLDFYQENADRILTSLNQKRLSQEKKASEMNKAIKEVRDNKIYEIEFFAKEENWSKQDLVNEILMLTYTFYIKMLEARNSIWPYEYMAFARRIGELWEPFCKIAFQNPIKELTIIEPPQFINIQTKIQKQAIEYIQCLPLDTKIKDELIEMYQVPWNMVDSGGINLNLDLHFTQNSQNFNCDFKSGFSSNEKGNTNRLLLVASIFKYLGPQQKQILFVRQDEEENNHYLQTLKNSNLWKVYCANDCYEAIKDFTGIDLRVWLDENALWEVDISKTFRDHLYSNDLLKYLSW